jgi:hypothetical protein
MYKITKKQINNLLSELEITIKIKPTNKTWVVVVTRKFGKKAEEIITYSSDNKKDATWNYNSWKVGKDVLLVKLLHNGTVVKSK